MKLQRSAFTNGLAQSHPCNPPAEAATADGERVFSTIAKPISNSLYILIDYFICGFKKAAESQQSQR